MRKEVKILGAIAIVVVIAAIIGASYYNKTEEVKKAAAPAKTPVDKQLLVKPDSPRLGPENAPVTLVEFYDPECESCRAMYPIVKKILNDYGSQVTLVQRYMPLHGNSMLAAQVTEAAGEQGKYWQMQQLLFDRQQEWGEKPNQPQTALFEKYAAEIGMNINQMRAAIADNRFTAKIERDKADGQSVGVRATPTFFVNGKIVSGLGEAQLKSIINMELQSQKQ